MSVMACSRVYCDNILCDRWSRTFGYICSDCFEELVEAGPEIDIDLFMAATYRTKPPKVQAPVNTLRKSLVGEHRHNTRADNPHVTMRRHMSNLTINQVLEALKLMSTEDDPASVQINDDGLFILRIGLNKTEHCTQSELYDVCMRYLRGVSK